MKKQVARIAVAGLLCLSSVFLAGCSPESCLTVAYPGQIWVDLTQVQATATSDLTVNLCIDDNCTTSYRLTKTDGPKHVDSPITLRDDQPNHEVTVTATTVTGTAVFDGRAGVVTSPFNAPRFDGCTFPIQVASVRAEGNSDLVLLNPVETQ